MTPRVVDTNVLVVANGGHERASEECQLACVEALLAAREGPVLIDSRGLILQEYGKKVAYYRPPRVGNEFYRWLLDHQGQDVCWQVDITPEGESFAEFPDDPDLARFDPSDRKFVAVARASGVGPPILNAVDTDWWNHQKALERNGVRIEFLCPQDMGSRSASARIRQ